MHHRRTLHCTVDCLTGLASRPHIQCHPWPTPQKALRLPIRDTSTAATMHIHKGERLTPATRCHHPVGIAYTYQQHKWQCCGGAILYPIRMGTAHIHRCSQCTTHCSTQVNGFRQMHDAPTPANRKPATPAGDSTVGAAPFSTVRHSTTALSQHCALGAHPLERPVPWATPPDALQGRQGCLTPQAPQKKWRGWGDLGVRGSSSSSLVRGTLSMRERSLRAYSISR